MIVQIYTKPQCPACYYTAAWLKKHRIPYEAHSLEASPEAMELAASKGYTAAPVVIAGAECWAGFQIERLMAIRAWRQP
jgi:glutaredoxin-like protein NrdH